VKPIENLESVDDAPARTLGELLRDNSPGPNSHESEWKGLVQAIAVGDQRALRELYDRMHALVYTLILRIVHDRRTAEELTLDVFLDIWRTAAGYSPAGGPVVGWVMNQARSRSIDQLRYQGRKKRVDPFPDVSERSEEDTAALRIDERQRDRELREAVALLTLHERNAIEMAFFSDCTYAEAAARLHEPPGTVKTRIRSGLEKLRVALGDDAPP
jgi:RNA polymerase sigma-70 factor, ECF subfamily